MLHYTRLPLMEISSNAKSAGTVETSSFAQAARGRTTTNAWTKILRLALEAKCNSIALNISAPTAWRRLGMPAA